MFRPANNSLGATGSKARFTTYHRNTCQPRGQHAQRRYLQGKARTVDGLVEYILSHEEYERASG